MIEIICREGNKIHWCFNGLDGTSHVSKDFVCTAELCKSGIHLSALAESAIIDACNTYIETTPRTVIPASALDVRITCDEFTGTLRQFFLELSLKVWMEEESFSGKRPWGNGGWRSEVIATLIEEGYIEGVLDEYRCIQECDMRKAYAQVLDLVLVNLLP